MDSLFLSLILIFSGISVTRNVCDQPEYMGHYNIKTDTIVICSNNVALEDEDKVLNHEVIHAVHENLGMVEPDTMLPPEYLIPLSEEYLSSKEVLSVLTTYDYPLQELEARILSQLPTPVVGFVLLSSEFYTRL